MLKDQRWVLECGMARGVLFAFPMEDRNGRARSPMESLARRQLEARRLSESSPIAGLGTYQVMRPTRGREVIAPQAPSPRPPRLPDGSDAFGTIERDDVPLEWQEPPRKVTPPPDEDRTMIVATRLYRAQIAPPPREETTRTGWLLPMALAAVISTILITLALTLR